MFVRLKKSSGTVNPIVQIVESFRELGKVKQHVLASLGSVRNEQDLVRLQALAKSLISKLQEERVRQKLLFDDTEGQPEIGVLKELPPRRASGKAGYRPKIEDIEHRRTIYDGFIAVVESLFAETGFGKIPIKSNRSLAYDPLRIAKILTAQRFFAPASKLRTYERQADLGIEDLKLHQIYRGMDLLLRAEELFQRRALAVACPPTSPLFKEAIECLFVDVTTLYFESVNTDELRNFGYSKDQKFHSVQVVLCLVVNSEGLPVAYETFSGNTAEVSTVIPVIEKLKKRFDVTKITIVCDRGLSSKGNIEHFAANGFNYVAACKIKHLPENLKLNDPSTFETFEKNSEDEFLVRRLEHPKYPKSDLIVTWSQKRAAKDKRDRDKILKRLEGKLGKEPSSPKVKNLVTNSGYRSFIKIDGGGKWRLNEASIAKSASWDGFHAIAISKSSNLTIAMALDQYRNLWRVEEAFRVSKSQLEIRPMFHWTPARIRAHVFTCFIALFLERYLEKLLRDAGKSQTPDRIRYALQRVHSVHFQDCKTAAIGIMDSSLTPDARAIFEVLSLPTKRKTRMLEI